MWILSIRGLLLAGMAGASVAYQPLPGSPPVNLALGVVLGGAIIFLETRIRAVSAKQVAGGFLGALVGVLFALLLSVPLAKIPMANNTQAFVQSLALLLLVYVGLMLGWEKGEWFDPLSIKAYFLGTTHQKKNVKILDTSVIIDGRIADLCETGFMDGTLIIPQFVLKELQQVADSADSLKRNRGRRGLDILQKVRKMSDIDVEISELDYPDVKEVDLKLIELAQELDAKIVTNDFNLNKVAQVRGVQVLNINELANALKPVVLPVSLCGSSSSKRAKSTTRASPISMTGRWSWSTRAKASREERGCHRYQCASDDCRQDDFRQSHRVGGRACRGPIIFLPLMGSSIDWLKLRTLFWFIPSSPSTRSSVARCRSCSRSCSGAVDLLIAWRACGRGSS